MKIIRTRMFCVRDFIGLYIADILGRQVMGQNKPDVKAHIGCIDGDDDRRA